MYLFMPHTISYHRNLLELLFVESEVDASNCHLLQLKGHIYPSHTIYMPSSISRLVSSDVFLKPVFFFDYFEFINS